MIYKKIDNSTKQIYIYEETNTALDPQLRLLRVFGQEPEIRIPDEIMGKKVTQIGSYCFSEKSHLSKEIELELQAFWKNEHLESENLVEEQFVPIAGSFLEKLMLPDSIIGIGDYTFYNCRKLEQISIGKNLMLIGSDAFMNCKSFQKLIIRGNYQEKTGLMLILAQVSSNLEVLFEQDPKLCIFYPEYLEHYEEIGPAHIFGLQIDGQGYRARKQFHDGKLDLPGYDLAFEKALSEEKLSNLARMAINRLCYPFDLREQQKQQYQSFITQNENELMKLLVQEQKEEELQMVCEAQIVSSSAIEFAITEALKNGWTKGSAAMIRWRKGAVQTDEYEF